MCTRLVYKPGVVMLSISSTDTNVRAFYIYLELEKKNVFSGTLSWMQSRRGKDVHLRSIPLKVAEFKISPVSLP